MEFQFWQRRGYCATPPQLNLPSCTIPIVIRHFSSFLVQIEDFLEAWEEKPKKGSSERWKTSTGGHYDTTRLAGTVRLHVERSLNGQRQPYRIDKNHPAGDPKNPLRASLHRRIPTL